jgi:hypothetical protein
MNKSIFFAIVLISSFIGCNAQKSQERSVTTFNKIKLSGALNVIYTSSDTMNLVVKAKGSELDRIETKVENSTLFISSSGRITSPVYVYVKNKDLQQVDASGATNFRSIGIVKADSILFNVTGAAELHTTIDTKKTKCVVDGAGSLALEGNTDELTADLASAAALKAYRLVAKNAVVVTTGASSAKVNVTDKLKATATSASEIKIKGEPREVSAESTTAASITRIKDNATSSKLDNDTTTYNWKKRKIMVIHDGSRHEKDWDTTKSSFKHWRGFSMAVNGFMPQGGGISLPQNYQFMELDYRRSFNFQFNIMEHQINLVKNYLKIVTGFGFDYHLYELANKTTLNADTSFTWGRIDSTNNYSYKKNKLRCTYIQVPLLLEINTSNNPDKAFHLAFGVIGQFMISSRTKQLLEQDKNEITNVRKDGYNMSPFAAKAHVNVGFRGWTFFGEYSLTPLFQSGHGPELYPFAAGLRVVPFS